MTTDLKILEAAIEAFNEKGVKFTMDDIAKKAGMSKKTIYTVYQDKETLLLDLIERAFESIKVDERAILNNHTLSTLEKIQKIIIVLPESLQKTDFAKFKELKNKYPKIYQCIQKRIETEWEPTLQLFEQGMAEGVIRSIPISVLKAMIEASMEHFLDGTANLEAPLTYTSALEAMMDIIIYGIQQGGHNESTCGH